jgi:hypothetical protein
VNQTKVIFIIFIVAKVIFSLSFSPTPPQAPLLFPALTCDASTTHLTHSRSPFNLSPPLANCRLGPVLGLALPAPSKHHLPHYPVQSRGGEQIESSWTRSLKAPGCLVLLAVRLVQLVSRLEAIAPVCPSLPKRRQDTTLEPMKLSPGSKVCFPQMQLVPLRLGWSPAHNGWRRARDVHGGAVQVESSVTHSFKAPGSNPWTYHVISWFQTLLSQIQRVPIQPGLVCHQGRVQLAAGHGRNAQAGQQ